LGVRDADAAPLRARRAREREQVRAVTREGMRD
jgi:hypothetical protein